MKEEIKNRLKQIGKFKLALISSILSIALIFGTVAGALEFTGSGTGSNGSYGTSGGTYNIPTPTAHNIPVGYRFSLVWKDSGDGSLHYATANYTTTIIDTDALNSCGDYDIGSVKFVLTNAGAGYNALSKIAIKRNLSSLQFKTASLDSADKRKEKKIFVDNSSFLSKRGLCNANGYFVLPNAVTNCELDSVIKDWQKRISRINKVIKLIGSKLCSNNSNLKSSMVLKKGDGLFIEPLWAFNYGGEKILATETEIALIWGNSSGHGMNETFYSDTSTNTNDAGNLAQTFGKRIPNRVYIKKGTLAQFRANFNSVHKEAFTLNGSDEATWENSSNRVTPNQVINGGYGICLVYSNNKDDNITRHKFTFQFTNNAGLGDYNPSAKSGYIAKADSLIYSGTSSTPYIQEFTSKLEGNTVKEQTKEDFTNFGILMQKKDYTKLNSTNQWIATIEGESTSVLLSQTENYTFAQLLSKLGQDYASTEIQYDSEPGVVVTLRPNITKASLNVRYQITEADTAAGATAGIYYNNNTFRVKAIYNSSLNKYQGYLFNGTNYTNYATTYFYPGEENPYGLYNASSFQSSFGIDYKSFMSGGQAYYVENDGETVWLDEDTQYTAEGLLSACGYDTLLVGLKNGNDQTITVSSGLRDNTGTVYLKCLDSNKPALDGDYAYDDSGTVVWAADEACPVPIFSGTKDESCTVSKDLNKINRNISGSESTYEFFESDLNETLALIAPAILEDSHTYNLDSLLVSVGASSLKRSDNVVGYLTFGVAPPTEETKITVKYHLGGIISTLDGTIDFINSSDVTSEGKYTVNDAGYLCTGNTVISDTFGLSDTIDILATADLGLTSSKYKREMVLSNSNYPYPWFYYTGKTYASIGRDETGTSISFSDFYYKYAPSAIRTSDGIEVTFYLYWKLIEADCYIYTTELYELQNETYIPTTPNNKIYNGGILEEDKQYAIKVVIKQSDQAFANHDTVDFKLDVEVGKYSDNGKTPISRTVSITASLNKSSENNTGICFFLVPYSNEFSTNGTYNNIEGFCDCVDNIVFLNKSFDVSDLIITNDLLNKVEVQTTGLNSYDDFNSENNTNNNRFYVSSTINYTGDSSDVTDIYPGNNEAIMYMFVKPNKSAVESEYKLLSDINDASSAQSFNSMEAYSGQTIQETATLDTNSVYNSYYKLKDEIDFYDNNKQSTYELFKQKYLVRNTSDGCLNRNLDGPNAKLYTFDDIDSTYGEGDGTGTWKTNGTYLSTAKTSIDIKELSNIKSTGTLYYPNASVSEHKETQVVLSEDSDITTSHLRVYPIDLIAAGAINTALEDDILIPRIKLYGYDEEGNSTYITQDLDDLSPNTKIGDYAYFQVAVTFDIRIGINYAIEKDKGSDIFDGGIHDFDTNIPVNIYFGLYSEKEGELFSINSDNFEFSSEDYREKVDGVDNNCVGTRSRLAHDTSGVGAGDYIYSLEFWSNKFEFDTYVNNSISYASSISLSNINLEDAEITTDSSDDETSAYAITAVHEGGVLKYSNELNSEDPINLFASETMAYSDLAKSFEYISNNNDAKNTLEFVSGTLDAVPTAKNQTYRKGTSVITSYKLYNYSEKDYIGDILEDKIQITGTIKTESPFEPTKTLTFTKPVIIPRAESRYKPTETLGWFNWDVSDEYCTGSYKFKIYHVYSDGTKKQIGTINFSIEDSVSYNTPDTTFTKTKPDSFNENTIFDYLSVPNGSAENGDVVRDGDSVEWSTYSYNSEALRFETVKYELKFYTIKSSIYNEQDASEENIASGYGITALYDTASKLTITKYNGEEIVSQTSVTSSPNNFTQEQNVTALFPEFNYKLMSDVEFKEYISDGISEDIWKERSGWNQYLNGDRINESCYGSCATLATDGQGHYVLPYNTSTLTRVHFLPIWYPDKDYSIKFVANEIWTPLGMISLVSESNSINVSGTMLDDWHYSSYTYIPDESEIKYIRKMAGSIS